MNKKALLHFQGKTRREILSIHLMREYGSYKGVIKREAVYKCTNKDYLPEAEPRANDHFTFEAKPRKGKMHCPRA